MFRTQTTSVKQSIIRVSIFYIFSSLYLYAILALAESYPEAPPSTPRSVIFAVYCVFLALITLIEIILSKAKASNLWGYASFISIAVFEYEFLLRIAYLITHRR
jgi:hypothetical protein